MRVNETGTLAVTFVSYGEAGDGSGGRSIPSSPFSTAISSRQTRRHHGLGRDVAPHERFHANAGLPVRLHLT